MSRLQPNESQFDQAMREQMALFEESDSDDDNSQHEFDKAMREQMDLFASEPEAETEEEYEEEMLGKEEKKNEEKKKNEDNDKEVVEVPICTDTFTFLPGCVDERRACRGCVPTYKSNKDLAKRAMCLDTSTVSNIMIYLVALL